jgi:hypothetical protein
MKFYVWAAAAAMMVAGNADAFGKGKRSKGGCGQSSGGCGQSGGGCGQSGGGCGQSGGGCGQSGFAGNYGSGFGGYAYNYANQPGTQIAYTQPTPGPQFVYQNQGNLAPVPHIANPGISVSTMQMNPGDRITLTIQDATGRAIDQNGQIFVIQPTQQSQAASPTNQQNQNIGIQPAPGWRGTNPNLAPTGEQRQGPQNSTSNQSGTINRQNPPNQPTPPQPQR